MKALRYVSYRLISVLTLAFCLPGCVLIAFDSSDAEARVKAGCLFNFAKFTTWPGEVLTPGAPVAICSMGGNDVQRVLETAFGGKKTGDHPVLFRRVSDIEDAAGCHVLFLSGPQSKEMKTVLKSARSSSMLIVGDDDTFAKFGTLLDFDIEGGRVVFLANGDAISRSRVHISSNLLSLAKFR